MRKPKKLKLSNRSKSTNWFYQHLFTILLIVGAAIVAGVFVFYISSIKLPGNTINLVTIKKPAEKYYSILNGERVTNEAAKTAPVTAVMIENSPEARPQSGLKKAGVVYEAVAEAGITRFMAFYQGEKPKLLGPVRSLRMHFMSWGAPYQAGIAHVGGSRNALNTVRSGNYRDLDQFFNSGYYWRSNDRYAPHNMYTSGEKLDQLNKSKKYTKSEFESFKRKDGKPVAKPNAKSIKINFSGPLFNTSYNYDAKSNTYIRSLAGAAHKDRELGQITPYVVVALEVRATARPGAPRFQDLVTTGQGKAYIFQDGTVIKATWKKSSLNDALRLVDSKGQDIELNRGQTWISAITPGRGSVTWQ